MCKFAKNHTKFICKNAKNHNQKTPSRYPQKQTIKITKNAIKNHNQKSLQKQAKPPQTTQSKITTNNTKKAPFLGAFLYAFKLDTRIDCI